jgi:hypothetical protein
MAELSYSYRFELPQQGNRVPMRESNCSTTFGFWHEVSEKKRHLDLEVQTDRDLQVTTRFVLLILAGTSCSSQKHWEIETR